MNCRVGANRVGLIINDTGEASTEIARSIASPLVHRFTVVKHDGKAMGRKCLVGLSLFFTRLATFIREALQDCPGGLYSDENRTAHNSNTEAVSSHIPTGSGSIARNG